jgi:uncharacterized protein involved in exopolysaccharide biosynthesis
MDQGRDKNEPPSASYRETFQRHRKLFCMPVVLGALAAAFFLFGMGTTYRSTANLWIDTMAPATSSLASDPGPLAEPPAAAEQGILNELLTTGSFTSLVAEHSLLVRSLGSADAARANAVTLLGSGQIVSTVTGNQVLQISYSASSLAMAKSVLGAVIAQLRDYTGRLTAEHARAAIAYDREQVNVAQAALATARRNVTAYQAQHPGVTPTDPNYVSLVGAENNAVTQLAQANTALSQVTGTGNANGWSLQVIDPPTSAGSAPVGKKKIAEVILGGALGGALVSFLAVIALTPKKKEKWEDELPIGKPFGPDVPSADSFRAGSPRVPTAPARSNGVPAAVGRSRLSLGDRRFQFRSPSAHTDEQ